MFLNISLLIKQDRTHAFIYRMLANHSAEYPAGFMDRATLKSFYAMTGPDNNLVYTPGAERIPDNWYTRAVGDPYDTAFFASDVKTIFQENPDTIAFGGNTGTVNSFTPLDLGDFTVCQIRVCLAPKSS